MHIALWLVVGLYKRIRCEITSMGLLHDFQFIGDDRISNLGEKEAYTGNKSLISFVRKMSGENLFSKRSG